MVDSHNLMSAINLRLLEDNSCRNEICFTLNSLLHYARRLGCYDVVYKSLCNEIYRMSEDTRFRVVDMEYNINIYDGYTAVYRYLYSLLRSNKEEDIEGEISRFGRTSNPIDEVYCSDSLITHAIDYVGYTHFLSCSCMESLSVSISMIYAHNEKVCVCDLFTNEIEDCYNITLFAHEEEEGYIESILRAFAQLFSEFVILFGYDKAFLEYKRGSGSLKGFIEECFLNYTVYVNEMKEVKENKQYQRVYPVVEEVIKKL